MAGPLGIARGQALSSSTADARRLTPILFGISRLRGAETASAAQARYSQLQFLAWRDRRSFSERSRSRRFACRSPQSVTQKLRRVTHIPHVQVCGDLQICGSAGLTPARPLLCRRPRKFSRACCLAPLPTSEEWGGDRGERSKKTNAPPPIGWRRGSVWLWLRRTVELSGLAGAVRPKPILLPH